MRNAVFLILVLMTVLAQHAWLEAWWWAPDLPLALMVWALVDGQTDRLAWRALSLGVLRDAIDPGSWWFHTACALGLALAAHALRPYLFRTRMTSWALTTAMAMVAVRLADVLLASSPGEVGIVSVLVQAAGSALSAVAIGWTCAGLPAWMHPLGRGGA